jgi:hypothetical protein
MMDSKSSFSYYGTHTATDARPHNQQACGIKLDPSGPRSLLSKRKLGRYGCPTSSVVDSPKRSSMIAQSQRFIIAGQELIQENLRIIEQYAECLKERSRRAEITSTNSRALVQPREQEHEKEPGQQSGSAPTPTSLAVRNNEFDDDIATIASQFTWMSNGNITEELVHACEEPTKPIKKPFQVLVQEEGPREASQSDQTVDSCQKVEPMICSMKNEAEIRQTFSNHVLAGTTTIPRVVSVKTFRSAYGAHLSNVAVASAHQEASCPPVETDRNQHSDQGKRDRSLIVDVVSTPMAKKYDDLTADSTTVERNTVSIATYRSASRFSLTAPKKETRGRKKKPRDMPNRPLSAYNLFFQREHKLISSELKANSAAPAIGYTEMARVVSQRWKAISDEEATHLRDAAANELVRYKQAMEIYYKNRPKVAM